LPKRKKKQLQQEQPRLNPEQFQAVIEKYRLRRQILRTSENMDADMSTSPEVQAQLVAELESYRGSIGRANKIMGI
jgi:hypothetical protein